MSAVPNIIGRRGWRVPAAVLDAVLSVPSGGALNQGRPLPPGAVNRSHGACTNKQTGSRGGHAGRPRVLLPATSATVRADTGRHVASGVGDRQKDLRIGRCHTGRPRPLPLATGVTVRAGTCRPAKPPPPNLLASRTQWETRRVQVRGRLLLPARERLAGRLTSPRAS